MSFKHRYQVPILFVIALLGCIPSIALGGDFDRDIKTAIEQINKDQLQGKDKEYDDYVEALQAYNNSRNEVMGCMLETLKLAGPDTNIPSSWRRCTENISRSFLSLKMNLLLIHREYNQGDSTYDNIGLKDFMQQEEPFTSTLSNNVAFAEAGGTMLFLAQRTRDATSDLEAKWQALDKQAQEVDSGRKSALSVLKEMLDDTLDLFAQLAEHPEFPHGDIIKILDQLNKTYPAVRAFWLPYKVKDKDVFNLYVKTKAETDAMLRSDIRIGLVQDALARAESETKASTLMARQDYVLFRGKVMEILRGHAEKAKAAHDELVAKNKGRFLDRLSSSNRDRIVDQDLYDRERALLEKTAKQIDKVIQKLEDKAQSTRASDEVKGQLRNLKEWRPYYKLFEEWEREYIERESMSRPAKE
ncbi:MAG: hypothetical protein CV089_05665 [Nitrospira sp. WS110]|nr:hypothetical protein [Nitrospira sp. WS110]